MDEFADYDRAAFIRAIVRLRDDLKRQTDEVTRLLRSEDSLRTLVRQVEGHAVAEASGLQAEVEQQKWCATRHEHRAEAFKEVISMLIGGGK